MTNLNIKQGFHSETKLDLSVFFICVLYGKQKTVYNFFKFVAVSTEDNRALAQPHWKHSYLEIYHKLCWLSNHAVTNTVYEQSQ